MDSKDTNGGGNPVPALARETSDEELARRVLEGDVELYELLVRRHNGRVYRAVRSILRDEDEAEGAMQEAYVRAYLHLGELRAGERFAPWLTRIAVREALARRRQGLRLVPLEENEERPTLAPGPEAEVGRREIGRILERAIDGLPDLYRPVLVLREMEGLDTAETARVLGITEDAVKQRLHRARARLRRTLEALAAEGLAGAFPFEAPRCNPFTRAVMDRVRGIAAGRG
jgi:RNA polymerase sigma-70 factor (ECF subfamily)